MPSNADHEFSTQEIENKSFDKTTSVAAREILGFDGSTSAQREVSKNVAVKVTVSGNVTYVAKATVGSLQAAAVWQAKKIDATTGVVITWADGNASFDNVATDLTILTYS